VEPEVNPSAAPPLDGEHLHLRDSTTKRAQTLVDRFGEARDSSSRSLAMDRGVYRTVVEVLVLNQVLKRVRAASRSEIGWFRTARQSREAHAGAIANRLFTTVHRSKNGRL
jgi:hypothetical protein